MTRIKGRAAVLLAAVCVLLMSVGGGSALAQSANTQGAIPSGGSQGTQANQYAAQSSNPSSSSSSSQQTTGGATTANQAVHKHKAHHKGHKRHKKHHKHHKKGGQTAGGTTQAPQGTTPAGS